MVLQQLTLRLASAVYFIKMHVLELIRGIREEIFSYSILCLRIGTPKNTDDFRCPNI